MRRFALFLAVLCAVAVAAWAQPPTHTGAHSAAGAVGSVRISIVGTNDLHGRVERVAVLSGFLRNLRAARERDGGAVLLIDGGDMFQGTLESNLGEGAAVVRAYNLVGYTVAAIGNHEFDFGPVGPHTMAETQEEDRRGALKARAQEAHFPFLGANIIDRATRHAVDWPNVRPSTLVDAAGVKVGIVGVTTESTPRTTIAPNVEDLRFASIVSTVKREAQRVRRDGAELVIITAHAGGDCSDLRDPHDISHCGDSEEIFRLARALPHGLVDAIVAGHTHAPVAHFVNNIPIIESYANGRAFGRIDIVWDRATRRVADVTIEQPHALCPAERAVPLAECHPGVYEGQPVQIDQAVLDAIAPDLARGDALRNEPLGVVADAEIRAVYRRENPLGNLLADLMRAARPQADVTLMNGGGIRTSIPAGPVTYGRLFEVFPFDNRFATLHLTVRDFKKVLMGNMQSDGGFLSLSGVTVNATCDAGHIHIDVLKDNHVLSENTRLTIVTSDFLALGGDSALAALGRNHPFEVENSTIREALLDVLRARGGHLRPNDPTLQTTRVSLPSERPVRCQP